MPELKKKKCCCGATEKNPCACMKKGIMKCSAKKPMCQCYKDLKKQGKHPADLKKSFNGAWLIMKADEADVGICDGCMETALVGRLSTGQGDALLCYDCWRKEMQWRHLSNLDMEESGDYVHPNDYFEIKTWPHSDMEPGMEGYQ